MKKTFMSFVSVGLSILLSGSLSAQTDISKVPVKENQTISNYAHAYNNQPTNQQVPDLSKIKDGATLRKTNNLFKKMDPDRAAKTVAVSSDGKFALKLQAVRKEEGLVGAKIIVVADDVWGDGTGYQMLIDATATAYGDIIPKDGALSDEDVPKEIYDKFEYKIPANADGSIDTENHLSEETDSVVVPAGIYDFCFTNPTPGKALYIAAGKYGRADDFSFEEGMVYVFKIQSNASTGDDVSLVINYDLEMVSILSPMSNCGLTNSEKIKVAIINNGVNDIPEFDISYSINGAAFITEKISEPIASGKKMEYEFKVAADLSMAEALYEIRAVVTIDGDENRSNDTVKSKVMTFTPAVPPVDWNFLEADQAANCSFDDKVWIYYKDFAYAAKDTGVLASRCITMDTGQYRVGYQYLAGLYYFMFVFYDDFDIVYKKVGDKEWTILKSFEDVYTNSTYVTSEIIVDIKERGDYSFGITSRDLNQLYVYRLSVSKIEKHDIRITDFVNSLAPTTPLSHIAKSTITATVENRGVYVETGVKISTGFTDKKAINGESTPVDFAIDEVKKLTMEATITDVKAGDKLEYTVEASMTNEDAFPEDNIKKGSLMVSDTVFAWENITEFPIESGMGSNTATVSTGYIFELSELDTVTSVSIGWAPLLEEGATVPVSIRLYEFNKKENTLGKLYYSNEFKRDSKGGLVTHMISPRELPKGAYFIELKQMAKVMMSISMDGEIGGYFWTVDAGTGICGKVYDFGNVALRVNVGHNAKVAQKDAMVVSIPTPLSKGIFSANEKITAEITNNGKLPIENIPVVLLVNKTEQTKTIASIPAYGSADIEFEADLSTPGEYLIYVYTNLEGDENRINDTLNKVVTSKEPSNPYIMDFEDCEDFQTSEFDPNWKSVDVDGATPTYGFEKTSFPGMGEALGFLVFNPSTTTPPLASPAAVAQNGERFGVSISSETATNSDWLISPKLQLKQESKLEFYVKTFNKEYGLEIYNVLISTTNDDIDSFKPVLSKQKAPENWEKVTVDLKDYNGKDVYIAIQCVSKDIFMFMLDNIKVITEVSNEKNNSNLDIRVFPNPATDVIQFTSVGVEIDNIVIYNMLGSKIHGSAKKLGTNNYRYNVQGLNTGVYFARISTTQGTELIKFVVR